MIKIFSPSLAAADLGLVLSYARATSRPGLAALLALDDRLASVVRTTREPLVGQMRLTWWYEALGRLDSAPPPAEPILSALHATVLPAGVSGEALAAMADDWEAMLLPSPDHDAVATFAQDRGRRVFELAARVLAVEDDRIGMAGEGWALADMANRVGDAGLAAHLADRARSRLEAALNGRWFRDARPLGALALLARFDVMVPSVPQGSARRAGRLMLHRLTGR